MEEFFKIQLFNAGLLLGKNEFDQFYKEIEKEINNKIQSVASSVYVSKNLVKEGGNTGKYQIEFYQTGQKFFVTESEFTTIDSIMKAKSSELKNNYKI